MSTVFHNILRAADKRYARRFAVLGAVFLAVLLGSLLLGRYALSPGQLLHMLWTKVTGGAADWPLSDDKVVFAVRLPWWERRWRCPARRIRGCSATPWCRRTFWGPPPGRASARQWPSCWVRAISAFPPPPSAAVCWPWRRRGW